MEKCNKEKAYFISAGCALPKYTRLHLENSTVCTNSNPIVSYRIPQAPGNKFMTWAVNWTKWDPSHKYSNILVGKAKKYVHDYRKYIKYQNALDFYRVCTSNVARLTLLSNKSKLSCEYDY